MTQQTKLVELPGDEQRLLRAVLKALGKASESAAFQNAFINDKNRANDAGLVSDVGGFEEYWPSQQHDYRNAFRHLCEHKRLRNDDAEWAAAEFKQDVVVESVVAVANGRASISYRPRFRSVQGALAYALLKLSDVAARIVVCEECATVTLDTPRVGAPMTRFCSARCRNRFGQRELRARVKKSKAAKKHK